MSLAKGIKVQPSRFAALNIDDSDSESEASGGEWFEVVGKAPKSKGGAQQQHRDGATGARPLSKSAKKRARKKKNQRSSSEVGLQHVIISEDHVSFVHIQVKGRS